MPTPTPSLPEASRSSADALNPTPRALRISKRIRNLHRKARSGLSLKSWALKQAVTATGDECRANPQALDRKRALTTAALAYHWLAGRGGVS